MTSKKNKTVAKKTAASTKKSVKAPKPTATDEVIKCYKKAKNPVVEQAATEVLSHKYSNQKKPSNREVLAKIKGCKPEEVLKEEIKQVNGLVTLHQKRIESRETSFYSQPYNSYCTFMEKVPDETMDLFQDINKLTGIKASRFSTIQDTEELLKKMLFNDKLIKVKVGETKAFICLTKCILSCWSINQASLLPL
jgi:CRISPR/Cas system CMR-associated protein Cmr3 (group 5 of RAMP superfamily)